MDRYEPAVNRLVEELCDHYAVAVLSARPAQPRDKEHAVHLVATWPPLMSTTPAW